METGGALLFVRCALASRCAAARLAWLRDLLFACLRNTFTAGLHGAACSAALPFSLFLQRFISSAAFHAAQCGAFASARPVVVLLFAWLSVAVMRRGYNAAAAARLPKEEQRRRGFRFSRFTMNTRGGLFASAFDGFGALRRLTASAAARLPRFFGAALCSRCQGSSVISSTIESDITLRIIAEKKRIATPSAANA